MRQQDEAEEETTASPNKAYCPSQQLLVKRKKEMAELSFRKWLCRMKRKDA